MGRHGITRVVVVVRDSLALASSHAALPRMRQGIPTALLLLLLLLGGCSLPTAPAPRYEWLGTQWVEVPGGRYISDGVDYRFDDGIIRLGVLGR